MVDAEQIVKLVQVGSEPASIRKVQALAAATMRSIGYKYPSKSCAATLSHFLREAGIDVPVTTGAQNLADRLRIQRRWSKIEIGNQVPGDVGVCKSIANDVPGADHIYLVIENKDGDLMTVADNQAQGRTHLRRASGKPAGDESAKTPTDYFLRAPGAKQVAMADLIGGDSEVHDESTTGLPELFMDDGTSRYVEVELA